MDLFSVKNKVVFITGSTSGLGFTLARGFVEAGAKVVINDRNQESVNVALEQLVHEDLTAGAAFDV